MNSKLTLNYVLFLVLSFFIIFGYSYYFGKTTNEEKAVTPQTTENIQNDPSGNNNAQTSAPVQAVSNAAENVNHYDELLNKDSGTIVTVNSPIYTAKIDTLGGRITEWSLKDYNATTAKDSPPVNIINGEKTVNNQGECKRGKCSLPYTI